MVTSQAVSITQTISGGATTFPFNFYVLDEGCLRVSVGGVPTALWSATGFRNNGGGTVTLTGGAFPNGSVVKIWRDTPLVQPTTFAFNSAMPSESIEDSLDRSICVVQEQRARIAELTALNEDLSKLLHDLEDAFGGVDSLLQRLIDDEELIANNDANIRALLENRRQNLQAQIDSLRQMIDANNDGVLDCLTLIDAAQATANAAFNQGLENAGNIDILNQWRTAFIEYVQNLNVLIQDIQSQLNGLQNPHSPLDAGVVAVPPNTLSFPVSFQSQAFLNASGTISLNLTLQCPANGDYIINYTTGLTNTGFTVVLAGPAPTTGYYVHYWAIKGNTIAAKGAPGVQGDKGDPGVSPVVIANSTTTGAPGTSALVALDPSSTQALRKLNFTIPRGADGATPQFTVNDVETHTLAPGSAATAMVSVDESSTPSFQKLNFVFGVPRGLPFDGSTPGGQSALIAALVNVLYPIGSLYASTSEVNPGSFLGVGTWEKLGTQGDTSVTPYYVRLAGTGQNALATGGANTATLTAANIPQFSLGTVTFFDGGSGYTDMNTTAAGAHSHNLFALASTSNGNFDNVHSFLRSTGGGHVAVAGRGWDPAPHSYIPANGDGDQLVQGVDGHTHAVRIPAQTVSLGTVGAANPAPVATEPLFITIHLWRRIPDPGPQPA